MTFELMILLYSLVIKLIELCERCFICTGDMLSRSNALEGFEFLIAVMVCSVVIVIGSILRLWRCLGVVRLVFSEEKFEGFVKYLLKAFAFAYVFVCCISMVIESY